MENECIFCFKERELTEEHIIPKALGGSLVIKNVCKICNDKMGRTFEAKTVDSILFLLPRFIYNISGRRDVPFPFEKSGITPDGIKMRLDKNFTPEIIPCKKKERPLPNGSKEIEMILPSNEESKMGTGK